jgi:hypothetical protein
MNGDIGAVGGREALDGHVRAGWISSGAEQSAVDQLDGAAQSGGGGRRITVRARYGDRDAEAAAGRNPAKRRATPSLDRPTTGRHPWKPRIFSEHDRNTVDLTAGHSSLF